MRHSKPLYLAFLVLLMLHSGCATTKVSVSDTGPSKPSSPSGQSATGTPTAGSTRTATAGIKGPPNATATRGSTPPPSTKVLSVTPFTGLEDEWMRESGKYQATGGIFSDSYTRLLVTSALAQGSDAALMYESRGMLKRLFVSKEFSINLTALVSAGSFKATVPLLTLDHKSSSEVGDQWSRVVYHTAENFPLFLVGASGSGATPEVRIHLRGNVEHNSRLVANGLQVALTAVQDVAPQSRIVTELSKTSLQKQANAIDKAISQLFGTGIDEGHWVDRDLRYWSWQKGVRVTLRIPRNENNEFSSNEPLDVGVWTVTFDDPRPSVFVDWRICNPMPVNGRRGQDKDPATDDNASAASNANQLSAGKNNDSTAVDPSLRCAPNRAAALEEVYRDVDAASVLQTSLTSGENSLGQIGNYLSQQDWYKSLQASLVDGDAKKKEQSAAAFCLHINAQIAAVGLNTVDSGIAVWAVATAMPDLIGQEVILGNKTCKQEIDRVDKPREKARSS